MQKPTRRERRETRRDRREQRGEQAWRHVKRKKGGALSEAAPFAKLYVKRVCFHLDPGNDQKSKLGGLGNSLTFGSRAHTIAWFNKKHPDTATIPHFLRSHGNDLQEKNTGNTWKYLSLGVLKKKVSGVFLQSILSNPKTVLTSFSPFHPPHLHQAAPKSRSSRSPAKAS